MKADLIGDGSETDPYRPDYDDDYRNASFDHETNTVEFDTF